MARTYPCIVLFVCLAVVSEVDAIQGANKYILRSKKHRVVSAASEVSTVDNQEDGQPSTQATTQPDSGEKGLAILTEQGDIQGSKKRLVASGKTGVVLTEQGSMEEAMEVHHTVKGASTASEHGDAKTIKCQDQVDNGCPDSEYEDSFSTTGKKNTLCSKPDRDAILHNSCSCCSLTPMFVKTPPAIAGAQCGAAMQAKCEDYNANKCCYQRLVKEWCGLASGDRSKNFESFAERSNSSTDQKKNTPVAVTTSTTLDGCLAGK